MSDFRINDTAANFVSDWRKRTAEQQRKHLKWSICAFLVVFASCLLMFFWFQNKNYERIVSQNMRYVQDSAVQEANQVEREFKNGEIMIENLANQYATLLEINDYTTVEEKLAMLSDKNIFDNIAYMSPDGTDTSLEGVEYVADREYFKRAISGKSGWELLEKSRVTGSTSVVFYSPITVDSKIVGVMAGFYERERLDDLFSYWLFNYSPNTYLLDGMGNVVANSKDELTNENLLDRLSKETFIGDTDYEAIEEVIADSEENSITFSFIKNNETVIGVIVQFTDSDWMMLSILPYNITSAMVSNANVIGIKLIVSVAVVFLLFIVVLVAFLRLQNDSLEVEMSIATDNLMATMDNEKKQLSIIESLIDIYKSVYYVDLKNLDYQRIKEEDEGTSKDFPDSGDARIGFSIYLEEFISVSHKKEMKEFLDLSTLRQRLETDSVLTIEYQRQDNAWRRAIFTAAEYDNNGTIESVVFSVQRIDEEKKKELDTKQALKEAYESAQIANNAKTTFLSNMSHDIRTPMNAIIGMTAIAASNLDNTEKVADCLKKITSSSKHLLGLINEVLDMSKIESGKVDLIDDEFSLSDLIDDLISINQPLINAKNHTLIVKVNNLIHENVIGDSTRLQQVFTNLLSNAIKYTPDNGKIEIIISEKDAGKPNIGWYEVVFKDNGIGMSKEFQKVLFELFARAKDERISDIQGTGLGMPIAKNIINMMSGDITVESEIDKGSTFTVSFAMKLQPEEEVDYESFVDLPILVVDDDIVACESACVILNSLSMNSEWVTSGREAVLKAVDHHEKNNDYYAVIVDWKMPDMNGIETTIEIRKRIGNDIPIIVISAYDWTDIEDEARAAGVNAFLSKPLFKSKVVGLFNELLGKHNRAEAESPEGELKNHDFGEKRILLVEDNELNREIAVEILSMMNLKTEIAENGKIGVDMFNNSQPGYYDLILMDIQMPVMNGYEATTAMRSLSHPDAVSIPIIAMSANAFSSDVRKAIKSGMNGHISKPIDINHMIKVLSENIG